MTFLRKQGPKCQKEAGAASKGGGEGREKKEGLLLHNMRAPGL